MSERLTVLSDIETLALEVEKARPIALALTALEGYARSVDMPDEEIERCASVIREMKPVRLKRVRKSLNAAAELSELLDLQPIDQAHSGISVSESSESVLIEQPAELISEEMDGKINVKSEGIPEESVVEESDAVLPVEALRSDLSEQGISWILKLVPDYDFEDKTISDIANELNRLMGEPKTRVFSGKKIDVLQRLQQRIQGLTNAEIAAEEGVTESSVNQWFRNFVEKRFRTLMPDEQGQNHVVESAQPELKVVPNAETAHDRHATSEAAKVTPSPLDVRFRPTIAEVPESVIELSSLIEFWAREMKLGSDDADLLLEALDPDFQYDLTGNHRSKLHYFRQFMESHLPQLEDSDLDLSTNEIARLSRLFGREEVDGTYSFTAKPQSARELSTHDGYIVPQHRSELLSGLKKLHDYMKDISDQTEIHALVSQFEEVLARAGFSDEQIIGLQSVIGRLEGEGVGSNSVNDGLRSLQTLFIDNEGKLQTDKDRDLIASLRMLTNTAVGRKTVRDVYQRLHAKDSSVTQASVTQMLEDGIIRLAI